MINVQSMASIPDSAVLKTGQPLSSLRIATQVLGAVNHLNGYLLDGVHVIHSPITHTSGDETGDVTHTLMIHRHPYCKHLDVFVRIGVSNDADPQTPYPWSIVVTAGTGTPVSTGGSVPPIEDYRLLFRAPWDDADSSYEPVTIALTKCTISQLMIADHPREFLEDPEGRVEYLDQDYPRIGVMVRSAIAASPTAGPKGMIQEILDSWANHRRPLGGFVSRTGGRKTVTAGTFTSFFGDQKIYAKTRQKTTELSNNTSWYLYAHCTAGVTYSLKVESALTADTVTVAGLTNTTEALCSLKELLVSTQDHDEITISGRITAGSGTIYLNSFTGGEYE